MIYDYKCESCGHELIDVQQSIKDKPLIKCPSCKKHGLYRVIFGGIIATVKEIKTIGQLSDDNSKKNKSRISEAAAKNKEENPEKPKEWWQKSGKTDREINRMSPDRRQKWIMEGN